MFCLLLCEILTQNKHGDVFYLYYFSYFYLLLLRDNGHQPASSEVTRTDLSGNRMGLSSRAVKISDYGSELIMRQCTLSFGRVPVLQPLL